MIPRSQPSPTKLHNTTISAWIFLLTAVTVLQFITNISTHLTKLPSRSDSFKVEKVAVPFLRQKNKEQPFNQTNPYYDSWCPYARCYNSPLCSPCNRRFLFIIATGRSGSTTLLRMFNELPNVRLSGENMNELYLASQLVTNLEKDNNFLNEAWVAKGRYQKPKIDGPFQHNALPLGSMSCVSQQLVSTLNPPEIPEDTFEMEDDSKTILGMKVIRLQRADWTPKEAAKYLRNSFPCARFIINVRSNMTELAQSYRDNFHWNVSESDLFNKTEFLRNLHTELGYSSFLIDMKWWRNNVQILNDAIKWLGFENCSFKSIYHENKGGYERDANETISLGDNCRYPHV